MLAVLLVLAFPSGIVLATGEVNNVNGPVNIVKHGNSFNAAVNNGTGDIRPHSITADLLSTGIFTLSPSMTVYNIPYGHDGWTVGFGTYDGHSPNLCGNPPWAICDVGPFNGNNTLQDNSPNLGVINGTDLASITPNSFVIAEQVNNGFTKLPNNIEGNAFSGSFAAPAVTPSCTVWDVFTHGFHAYCPDVAMPPQNTTNAVLRVLVINP